MASSSKGPSAFTRPGTYNRATALNIKPSVSTSTGAATTGTGAKGASSSPVMASVNLEKAARNKRTRYGTFTQMK